MLKYENLYKPLYEERAKVVSGGLDKVIEKQAAESRKEGDSVAEDDEAYEGEADPEGIPEFWSCTMRSHDVIGETITEKDEDVI